MLNRRIATLAVLAVSSLGMSSAALAESAWQQAHPRRTEVNSRLNHQDQRIHNEVKTGQISRGQASAMHHEDHQIRGEERAMASQDGGHITKADQRALNQQENGVSAQIAR